MTDIIGRGSALIDTHMHIFETDWIDAAGGPFRYLPEESASFEGYRGLAEPQGVDSCLIVQPSFLKKNNDYIAGFLNNGTPPFATWGTAVVSPEMSVDGIRALRSAGFVGVRLNLIASAAGELVFPLSRYGALWHCLNELGMHVEVHVEGELLMKVLEQLMPHLDRIVVDHFMRPPEGKGGAIRRCPAVYGDVGRYSDPGKIWVKASAPYRVFPDSTYREAVDNCAALAAMLADILGKRRLLWGSDWPHTQSTNLVAGRTAVEKYGNIAATYAIWSKGGVVFDSDAAFAELVGTMVQPDK